MKQSRNPMHNCIIQLGRGHTQAMWELHLCQIFVVYIFHLQQTFFILKSDHLRFRSLGLQSSWPLTSKSFAALLSNAAACSSQNGGFFTSRTVMCLKCYSNACESRYLWILKAKLKVCVCVSTIKFKLRSSQNGLEWVSSCFFSCELWFLEFFRSSILWGLGKVLWLLKALFNYSWIVGSCLWSILQTW